MVGWTAARPVVVSASPSQLRVRVGVDATFVCRLDGELASSRQLRWSRPVGVTALIHSLLPRDFN